MNLPPLHPCNHSGCHALTRERYCPQHKPMHQWNHTQSAAQRGYDRRWRKLREAILRRDKYLCRACKREGRIRAATDVDHILSKAAGGTDHESNLESLCKTCHRLKTAQDSISARKNPTSRRHPYSGYNHADLSSNAQEGAE